MTTIFLISLRLIYHKIDAYVRFSMNFKPLRCSRNALGICGGRRFDFIHSVQEHVYALSQEPIWREDIVNVLRRNSSYQC
jgi:hypothetical protein